MRTSLSLAAVFGLKYIFFWYKYSYASFFCFSFPWNIFFQPFTLSPCIFLKLKWISYRQRIVGPSFSFYLLYTFWLKNFIIFLAASCCGQYCSPSPSLFQAKHISVLLVMGSGKTKVGSSCSTLRSWGSWRVQPPPPFLVRGALSSQGVPFWSWAVWPWVVGWGWQMKLPFPPFLCNYS